MSPTIHDAETSNITFTRAIDKYRNTKQLERHIYFIFEVMFWKKTKS